ncbi:hypothetical protein ACIBSS_27695 [Micromonospora aurantiaca]|uniref:hypothetical protein n=1 Tax=Micromonospora aurantiaca (nom. illeg.) TaxID=47850 RepID=UPI00379B8BF3
MTTVQQDADIVVRIEPWAGTGYAKIRITPGCREQLQGLLTEAGVDNSMALEFSAGSAAMELISIAVSTPEVWVATGGAVGAFIGRHVGRRVRVEVSDRTVADLHGYSRKDAESLMRTIPELHDIREAEWQQLLRRNPETTTSDQLPDA